MLSVFSAIVYGILSCLCTWEIRRACCSQKRAEAINWAAVVWAWFLCSAAETAGLKTLSHVFLFVLILTLFIPASIFFRRRPPA